jgi:flagellar biosynthesis/type III secretory pathway chaperone
MTDTTQAADLIRVTSRLIRVLEREIEALRAAKPSEIQSLQEDKMALAAAYEAQLRALQETPETLAAVAPSVRAELDTVIGRFREVLAANEHALRAAKETTGRILRAIADEIERQRDERTAYTANGGVQGRARAAPGRTLSVAFDERL